LKPVGLNQLLFHSKCDTLSFFRSPLKSAADLDEVEHFFSDMLTQLGLQKKEALFGVLEKQRSAILKIMKLHPEKSHGFFLSENLEGYMVMEGIFESFCTMGQTFYVRPLIEELFSHLEFLIVDVSLYDVRVYKGDFHSIEILKSFEFDQQTLDKPLVYTPQHLGLIPYKKIHALKNIALDVKELVLYNALPVIVTGPEDIKALFIKQFGQFHGVITNTDMDFYEKTCAEILELTREFRPAVMDFYSAALKERLIRLIKSKRLVTDLGQIVKAISEEKVAHLILPYEKKLWGIVNFEKAEFEVHAIVRANSVDILNALAEKVIHQGGKIQILRPHFFPQDSTVLAILGK